MSQGQSFCFSAFPKVLLSFGILALLLNFSCSSKSKKNAPGAGDKIYPVSVLKVSKEEVPDIIEVKGNFIPFDKLDVKSETEGKVFSSPVSEGQTVNLGDPLVTINPEQLNLLLEKEKLELKEQEAKIDAGLALKNASPPPRKTAVGRPGGDTDNPPNPDQTPDNNPDNPNPPSADQIGDEPPGALNPPEANPSSPEKAENGEALARANEVTLDRIKAEIALTEKKIESANVTAAISGMISKKNITEGSAITLGEVLFQIVKIDPILLSVFVDKKMVGNIQKGEKMDVKVDEMPDVSLNGEVTYVAAEADSQNKNYEIRISVPNTQLKIRAGMAGLAILSQSGMRKALMIPEVATLNLDGKVYAYVMQGQVAERKEIELGAKSDGKVEVKSGLKEGEEVVVKGQATFKDEQEFVRVE